VLIVSDDPVVLWSTERTLRQDGYATATAFDAPGALRAAQRLAPIALLVTELYMPQMNGIALTLRLRRDDPALRTLYLIRHGDELLPRQIALSRDEAFLQTPCGPRALRDAVCDLLHRDEAGGRATAT
jgi:DNA-binding NtrC family response regulator